MDEKRLADLQDRAERATRLAERIRKLNDAKPHECDCSMRYQGKVIDVLEPADLGMALSRGIKQLARELEADLEAIMGGDKQDAVFSGELGPEVKAAIVAATTDRWP